jgi:hypothetical protein
MSTIEFNKIINERLKYQLDSKWLHILNPKNITKSAANGINDQDEKLIKIKQAKCNLIELIRKNIDINKQILNNKTHIKGEKVYSILPHKSPQVNNIHLTESILEDIVSYNRDEKFKNSPLYIFSQNPSVDSYFEQRKKLINNKQNPEFKKMKDHRYLLKCLFNLENNDLKISSNNKVLDLSIYTDGFSCSIVFSTNASMNKKFKPYAPINQDDIGLEHLQNERMNDKNLEKIREDYQAHKKPILGEYYLEFIKLN